nr:alpha/beta family hydrolase [Actinoalloteichus spitiensis]
MPGMEVETPVGTARAEVHGAAQDRGVLLLGHGAGGGTDSPDLVTATRAAVDAGVHVVTVEQPYRVAGRRAPAPTRQLDTAWLAVASALASDRFPELPLLFGGRSSGARVACRTAGAGGAEAVLCLAFPVHPPGKPEKHRLAELDGVEVPVLVVQGESDPFGRPEPAPRRQVVLVAGNHALRGDQEPVYRAVHEWLDRVLRPLDLSDSTA